LVLFLIIYLINPFQLLHQSSRFWLLKVLWRVILAPFYKVGFADFWLADQLNSFDLVFGDIQYFVCWNLFESNWAPSSYFKENDLCPCSPNSPRDLTNAFNVVSILLGCYPAWLRFAQCLRRYRDSRQKFPHLANALKYSTTFIDTGFQLLRYHYSSDYERDYDNPYFYLWIFIRCIGTLYKYWWDIRMDWGFFDKNAGENRFLREQCVYSSKWYYYFAIVQNFILRFFWLIRLYDMNLPRKGTESYKDLVYTFIGLAEVYRRFIWNFFRLENEHLNNCGQFRAVRDIGIAPIRLDESSKEVKMTTKSDNKKEDQNRQEKDDSDKSNENLYTIVNNR
jgi:xenotropic and polytropic retrovirus receptor 1